MNRQTIISCMCCVLLGFIYGYVSYLRMSHSSVKWGMYGLTFLRVGIVFGSVGVILVIFKSARQIGAGVILGALILLLIGGAVCSGTIRF